MKKTLVFALFLAFMHRLEATSVLASSFGFSPSDATIALREAILSPNDTIIVDLQNAHWKIKPTTLFNPSNKTIIFEEGVVLEAIQGAFGNINACLFQLKGAKNIEIWGYGATFKMHKAEYAALNDSEYRHSLSLWNCDNIAVRGLHLDESGGDGIYIGGDNLDYCTAIFLEDVVCSNHYRQGMSITNVENMTVRHCKFQNTAGTLPEAGVDVEPYQTTQRVVHLKFEQCAFEGNGWSGLALALFEMDNTSLPVSITVQDCYFRNNCLPTNSYALCEIFLSADDDAPVQGNVLFERCLIDGSQYAALYTRKTADAYFVTFKDCAFQNISQKQTAYNEPIFLEVPSYAAPSGYLGGLVFDNVLISYPTDFSFFRVYGWTTLAGIKDITGKFTVVEPNNNPVTYSNVPDSVNTTYTFTNQASLPATVVGITLPYPNAIECTQTQAIAEFSRQSSDISYPLGITYGTNSGTGTAGNDVHHFSGGFVFPAQASTAQDSITARADQSLEGLETLGITLFERELYTLGSVFSAQIALYDCTPASSSVEHSEALGVLEVLPNPASFIARIITESQPENIALYGLDGKKYPNVIEWPYLHVNDLPNGVYLVQIKQDGKVFARRLVVVH
jgi:hypothetical protein